MHHELVGACNNLMVISILVTVKHRSSVGRIWRSVTSFTAPGI